MVYCSRPTCRHRKTTHSTVRGCAACDCPEYLGYQGDAPIATIGDYAKEE